MHARVCGMHAVLTVAGCCRASRRAWDCHSLVLRVTKDRFSDAHSVTIGAAFSAKVVHTPGPRPASVKLHIWDTAGEGAARVLLCPVPLPHTLHWHGVARR